MAGATFWWSSCVTFHGRCSILVKFMCHFSWQVQDFGEVHVSLFMAGAAFWWSSCVTFHGRCSILVKFMCHFSWQVQHLVKFMRPPQNQKNNGPGGSRALNLGCLRMHALRRRANATSTGLLVLVPFLGLFGALKPKSLPHRAVDFI